MKKLLIAATIATTFTLGACTNNPTTTSSATYSDIVAQAKAAHQEAAAQGNVWKQKKMKKPYAEHYLAKAEAAKKAGNEAEAMKYAKLALKTAKAEAKQTSDYANIVPLWAKK